MRRAPNTRGVRAGRAAATAGRTPKLVIRCATRPSRAWRSGSSELGPDRPGEADPARRRSGGRARRPRRRSPGSATQESRRARRVLPGGRPRALAEQREQLARCRGGAQPALGQIPQTLVAAAVRAARRARAAPRQLDGRLGEIVQPGVPAASCRSSTSRRPRPTRLDLAHWLVSPRQPADGPRRSSTGSGSCSSARASSKTLDDFGVAGRDGPRTPSCSTGWPSSSCESGWDVKHMVRLIVTSRTLSADVAGAGRSCTERDPYNRLLRAAEPLPARRRDGPRQRAGGQRPAGRARSAGRASSRTSRPGYWAHLNFPTARVVDRQGRRASTAAACTPTGSGRSCTRACWRSTPRRREECTAERPRSNTPQQALVLLNDPTYVEAARVFAERIMTRGRRRRVEDRLDWAYRRALSRAPRAEEAAVLPPSLRQHRPQLRAPTRGRGRAARRSGRRRCPQDLDAGRAGRLDDASPASLLNLHETITRE